MRHLDYSHAALCMVLWPRLLGKTPAQEDRLIRDWPLAEALRPLLWDAAGQWQPDALLREAEALCLGPLNEAAAPSDEGLKALIPSLGGNASLYVPPQPWQQQYAPEGRVAHAREQLMPVEGLSPKGVAAQFQRLQERIGAAVQDTAAHSSLSRWISHLEQVLLQEASSLPALAQEALPLYEYARSVSGLAACLAANAEEGQGISLIGGSIRGIQKFLFQPLFKRELVMLKGRSFYVELLSEALVTEVLRVLDLPVTCLVSSAGGGFRMLAPALDATAQEQLRACQQTIEKALFKLFGVDLSLSLMHTSLLREVLQAGSIAAANQRLQAKEERQRYQPMLGAITETPSALFAVAPPVDTNIRESFTNEPVVNPVELPSIGNEDQLLMNERSEEVYWWGVHLRNEDALILQAPKSSHNGFVSDPHQIWGRVLPGFEQAWFVGEARELIAFWKQLPAAERDACCFRPLNDFGDGLSLPAGAQKRLLSYGGNEMPLNEEGKLATLGDSASDDEEGFKRLGALRMDVDNLGMLFGSGLPAGKAGPAWFATLSRQMDGFFKNYLNHLRGDECYCQQSLIIYAGGDDLFVVGHWLASYQLAAKIREDFARYAGGHPALSLSGGLSLLPMKYRMVRAAEHAGEAEERAKEHRYPEDRKQQAKWQKNSFEYLGLPLHWEHEWPIMQEYYTLLSDIEKADGASILRRIMRTEVLHQHYRKSLKSWTKGDRQGKQPVPQWIWQFSYDFGRFMKEMGKKAREPLLLRMEQFHMEIVCDQRSPGEQRVQPLLSIAALAARHLHLLRRAEKQFKNDKSQSHELLQG